MIGLAVSRIEKALTDDDERPETVARVKLYRRLVLKGSSWSIYNDESDEERVRNEELKEEQRRKDEAEKEALWPALEPSPSA